jgi:ribosomal protein L7/L12
MELTDAEKDAITQAIYTGRKIEAIKLYRESTGKGLKEAKDFIEAVTERLREEDPDRVSPTAKGCGTSVLAVLVLLGALGALLR